LATDVARYNSFAGQGLGARFGMRVSWLPHGRRRPWARDLR
jgi:hypothetical protein